MEKRQGFTLLEILVVVMIITILAAIVGVKVIPHLAKGKYAAATAQVRILKTALSIYRMDAGCYPTQEQGLQALVLKPTTEPIPLKYSPQGYLDSSKVPPDPWGREYVYIVPGPEGQPFEIISYGADHEPGGEAENADISSLEM